jgi:hypothetical protein
VRISTNPRAGWWQEFGALIGVAVVLGLTAPSAYAQRVVPRGSALQLASNTNHADGWREYAYQLTSRDRRTVYSQILLWLPMPFEINKPNPKAVAIRGFLQFDQAVDGTGAPWRHPSLRIATPDGWNAAIFEDALLKWGAQRYGGQAPVKGVRAGEQIGGFVLESNALPALRPWRVVPHQPLLKDWPVIAEVGPIDSTLVVPSGYILAPGWPADRVTWGFLAWQTASLCVAMMTERCGGYLQRLEAMERAHRTMDDAGYRRAGLALRAFADDDKSLHPWGQLVFREGVAAVLRRPPSVLGRLPANAGSVNDYMVTERLAASGEIPPP